MISKNIADLHMVFYKKLHVIKIYVVFNMNKIKLSTNYVSTIIFLYFDLVCPALLKIMGQAREQFNVSLICLNFFLGRSRKNHTCHISHCEILPNWKPISIFFKSLRIFRPSYNEINRNHTLLCLSQASYI